MKLMNPKKPVMASWLHELGHRLDSPPFLSGAIEARKILADLHVRKDRLASLTVGGLSGIIHAGRIPRIWVEDRDHGVPFLSSTDILQTDLSTLRLISNRAVAANPKLIIRSGWTLITRSGTVGRTAFARAEMNRMACTEDVLRVAPDESKVPAGYLYAFLSSRFGVPIVSSGTYGAIIQHIEPEHIADLPVPRFESALERKIGNLVCRAGENRTNATSMREAGFKEMMREFGLPDISESPISIDRASFGISSRQLNRLDAAHFSPFCLEAERGLANCQENSCELDIAARVFTPGFFKRIKVDDPANGYPYFSGSELFQIYPDNRGFLSKGSKNIQNYIVEKDWLLIQDAGQVGGLIGRIMRASQLIDQSAVSNHLIRVIARNRQDTGYLFCILGSPYGYRTLIRRAFGTSIPQIESAHVAKITIPWPDSGVRRRLGAPFVKSWELLDEADSMEQEAIELVEKAIEENA